MTLELTNDEALVLFEWICTINKRGTDVFSHPAEQKVAWGVEALLEKGLVEPLAPDYARLLEEARKRVADESV